MKMLVKALAERLTSKTWDTEPQTWFNQLEIWVQLQESFNDHLVLLHSDAAGTVDNGAIISDRFRAVG